MNFDVLWLVRKYPVFITAVSDLRTCCEYGVKWCLIGSSGASLDVITVLRDTYEEGKLTKLKIKILKDETGRITIETSVETNLRSWS